MNSIFIISFNYQHSGGEPLDSFSNVLNCITIPFDNESGGLVRSRAVMTETNDE